MKLSRKDAARRLLRSAIKGFVLKHDPLCVHLSAQSAFRICRDVVKQAAPDRDFLEGLSFGDSRSFFRDFTKLNNFLKHAEHGPGDIDIEGIENKNASLIYMACRYYEQAYGAADNERSIIIFQAYRLSLDPLKRTDQLRDLDPDLLGVDADELCSMMKEEFEWDDIGDIPDWILNFPRRNQ